MFWNANTLGLQSKGLTTKKANGLRELAARRSLTLSQFFSPLSVAEKMWALIEPCMLDDEPYSIVDNSIGSGRLLAFADPKKHQLFGCDVDERCINELSEDAKAANFNFEFNHSGLEDVSFSNISVGLINPPFSITLQSPNLYPYDCTNFGKFGANTHALAHEYSLAQALNGCSVVVALLPVSMRENAFNERRLIAEIKLHKDTFKEEGANVSTAVYVFNKYKRPSNQAVLQVDLNKGEPWPNNLDLTIDSSLYHRAKWKINGIDKSAPVFALPVTHDNTVGIHHHNKKIVLKFACALTQAKVQNGLLYKTVDRSDRHRYAKNIRYCGDGQFHLDAYLQDPSPEKRLNFFYNQIRELGGAPDVSPTLTGYFRKLVKRNAVIKTPFRKTVEQARTSVMQAKASRGMFLRKLDVTAPIIKKDELVSASATDGGYLLSKDNQEVFYAKHDFAKSFSIVGNESTGAEKLYDWNIINQGKNHHFPARYQQNLKRLEKVGVDFLWAPQRDAICELMMTNGAVAAWEQGTGKARGAIALCLASSATHTLIVVEGGLVQEMAIELKKIALPQSKFNIIHSVDDIQTLAKINIVSYTRLKMPLQNSKKTLSHLLRRRFGLVAADEGGVLSNPDSQQSRAVLRLAARKLFLLDGTPISSYPRDLLPLVCATTGEANPINPYSLRQHMLTDNFLTSANYNPRGIMAFKDKFVVLDWATHAFEEDLRGGAKREIPAIKDIPAYREWADLNVQRRLRNEPEFAPFTGINRPHRSYHDIEWDQAHLAIYIKEAVEFSNWYSRYKADQLAGGKGCSLVAVLAKIQAVIGASNSPHIEGERSAGVYYDVTSKQRAVVERTQELIDTTDDKIIIMAASPYVCTRFAQLLAQRNIESVLFTGKQDIKKRNKAMHEEYRFGSKRVLIMSSVGARGVNLPQANRFLMYNRFWTSDREEQPVARMLRPDQKKDVYVEYFHLTGGIDAYQAQVVEWKIVAAHAGLDYGENETSESEFRHLDAILAKFCNDVLGESLYDAHKRMCA